MSKIAIEKCVGELGVCGQRRGENSVCESATWGLLAPLRVLAFLLSGRWVAVGSLTLALALLGRQEPAWSKDLSSRLGVGYADQFGVAGLPSLAVRYYPNSEFGIAGHLGVDTQKDNSKFGFLAKAFRVVFAEDHLNFYVGAAAGLISKENAGRNESGFDLSGYFGAEFFLPGLDSLGWSFEAGVGVTSLSSDVRFRTIGDSPLRAGMIFYF